jgi:hypothetical protein
MIYITNGITHDGFGARIQRIISVMGLVEYLKNDLKLEVEYIHTPLSYIWEGENYNLGYLARKGIPEYPYNDITVDGYLNRCKLWDDKLNFNGNIIGDFYFKNYPLRHGYAQLMSDIKNGDANNKLYVIKALHKEYDSKRLDINIIKKYKDNITSKFSFNQIIKDNNDTKSVAIHVRAKDALDKKNIDARYLDYNYYSDIINKFNNKSGYDLKIYTQKIGFESNKYAGCNIIYDDVENDYDTFFNLIFSDYLIVAKSSFSYTAALLNNNTIIYHNLGHIKMAHWITKEELLNNLKYE